MKVYQLYWGSFLQWTKRFDTEEEAIKHALKRIEPKDKDDNKNEWQLISIDGDSLKVVTLRDSKVLRIRRIKITKGV